MNSTTKNVDERRNIRNDPTKPTPTVVQSSIKNGPVECAETVKPKNFKSATFTEMLMLKIAQSIGYDVTLTELREERKRITALPSENVKSAMHVIAESQSLFSRSRFQYVMCQMLLCTLSYRLKMPVSDSYEYNDFVYGRMFFNQCPRCQNVIEHEFQRHCSCCGQALSWKKLKKRDACKS